MKCFAHIYLSSEQNLLAGNGLPQLEMEKAFVR